MEGDRKPYIKICLDVIKWLSDVQYENPRWLRNNDFSVDDIPLKMYSNNALVLSHNISNYIFEKLKYEVVRRNTEIPFEEFSISVNARKLLTVYRFPPSKSVKICDIFEPINRCIAGINIQLLNVNAHLQDMFHTLYKPFPNDWNLDQIKDVLKNVKIQDLEDVSVGGKNKSHDKRPNFDKINTAKDYVFEAIHTNDLGIIIGSWALDHILNTMPDKSNTDFKKCLKRDKIQMISDVDSNIIVNHIKGASEHNVFYKKDNVGLLHDKFLEKTVFYFIIDDKKIPVLDKFNSTEYELVPYLLMNSVEIGNPFVLCRFFIIDLWVVKMLN